MQQIISVIIKVSPGITCIIQCHLLLVINHLSALLNSRSVTRHVFTPWWPDSDWPGRGGRSLELYTHHQRDQDCQYARSHSPQDPTSRNILSLSADQEKITPSFFTDHCGRWSSFPLVSANVNHCHLVFTMTRAAISRLWLGTLLTFGGLMQHLELWCFWDATINTPSLSDV